MADRENAIMGLGCLAGEYDMESNKCAGCGYRECATFAHCIGEIARDALSLLKAQEPRVMTLEEVAELEEHQFVWIEDSNSDEPIYCFEIVQLCGIVSINMEIALNTPSFICYVYTKDYNKKYRIWTSRPTDEQMEATPWQ